MFFLPVFIPFEPVIRLRQACPPGGILWSLLQRGSAFAKGFGPINGEAGFGAIPLKIPRPASRDCGELHFSRKKKGAKHGRH